MSVIRHAPRLRVLAAVAALALLLTACGGDDDPTLSGTTAASGQDDGGQDDGGDVGAGEAQEAVTIDMTDALTFAPAQVTITVGGTVTWENSSTVVHTATGDPDKVADPGNVELPGGAEPWDSGFVQPGDSFSQTFTEPGTYHYVCVPHEGVGMAGTIVVQP